MASARASPASEIGRSSPAWFAALGPAPPWFVHLVARLLEGSPDVIALLDDNPFPARPPRYVRALLYDYRMTDRETRRRTGAWWRRELLGTYVPSLERTMRSGSAGAEHGAALQ